MQPKTSEILPKIKNLPKVGNYPTGPLQNCGEGRSEADSGEQEKCESASREADGGESENSENANRGASSPEVPADLPAKPEAVQLAGGEQSGAYDPGGGGWLYQQTLDGSFSTVPKPNFASKYAFERFRRDLHKALLCTALKKKDRTASRRRRLSRRVISGKGLKHKSEFFA